MPPKLEFKDYVIFFALTVLMYGVMDVSFTPRMAVSHMETSDVNK